MAISDPLVLPDDIVLTPVEDLPTYMRDQLEYEKGDYVITRPRSRTPSRIVDAHTAELLKLFQTPTTIVQAVIRFSRVHKLEPEQVLTDVFPIIQNFIEVSFLVSADAVQRRVVSSFMIGDLLAGCEVLNCVHIIEDTEVYQVKRPNGEIAALKIIRSEENHEVLRMFEWETSILKYLDGMVNPALLEIGTFKGRRYLMLEWCSDIDVSVAAQALRNQPDADSRKKLLHLCATILDAYSHLHAQGVIHTDIHPGNILVASDGSIKIIDYGFARRKSSELEEEVVRRADASYFSEPEYAKAILSGLKVPAASEKGEQYSLAALLYYLLTGVQYLQASLEREAMLQRIMTGNPLPFSRWGIKPWSEVETLLATALRKHPADRFPSVSEFAYRLKEVKVPDEETASSPAQHITNADAQAVREFLKNVLQVLGPEGSLLHTGLTIAPTCSLTFGMTGIAYALYRIACVQNNAALLSLADIWSTKAVSAINSTTAFYNEEEINPEMIGYISPYHTASGVYCVQALISHAMGDFASQQEAIDAFIEQSKESCENIDLVLGRTGTLLASSFLLDVVSNNPMLNAAPLVEFGNEIIQSIWHKLNAYAAIQECTEITCLGIAHGWAGFLYAIMCWCQSAGVMLPDVFEERLQQLAACAESSGRGVRWKWILPQPGQTRANLYMPGWCNGSAGYIHLWTLAHRIFGNEMYARLAEQSAWNAWEESETVSSLCCGLTGQAYGLLNLYKHTGERSWLARAQELAQKAVANVKSPALHAAAMHVGLEARSESLYYGDVGIAVLAADLTRPKEACMPFFEREGWRL